jgi:hypothetical protein
MSASNYASDNTRASCAASNYSVVSSDGPVTVAAVRSSAGFYFFDRFGFFPEENTGALGLSFSM